MRASLLVFSTCLSACLASTHQPNRRQSPAAGGAGGDLDHFVYPKWSILNFDGNCSAGGCIMTFNISSAATTSEPAVSASCDINGDEMYWQACSTLAETDVEVEAISKRDDIDSSVWALPLPAVDLFALSVQHRFSNASLTPTKYYNVSGNMTVDYEKVTLPANLTVMGTRVSESWTWTTGGKVEHARALRDAANP